MLIGSGGSGKSTLAREMGETLGIEVFHLDKLFWKRGWTETPRDEWVRVQSELVQKKQWIIDGNFGGTIDIRLQAADTVIFIDMPRIICMYRVLKRQIQYYNRTRPDMGEECNEKVDLAFLKWIWHYPKRNRPRVLAVLQSISSEKSVVHLRTRRDVRTFLETCGNQINVNPIGENT